MSRPTALVGYTGLVGGSLRERRSFDLLVRSTNADSLRGGRFSHVVFSAARAEKWRANADPLADAAHIDELIELASSFECERFTLISTVDVFAVPVGVSESSPAPADSLHAYGAGRRRLEEAVARMHPDVLVVRLPGLFGAGLKKNVIFDLLHGNAIERIQPDSAFQYYDLTRLVDDLDLARDARLRLVHLVTEPIRTSEIVERVFERPPLPVSAASVVRYDIHTELAQVYGRSGPYIEDAPEVLSRLRRFVRAEADR